MLETIKNIDPSKISDVQGLRAALTVLINAVEQLLQEKEEMKKEIQRLRDENNKLKGGNVRPVTKNPAKRDISSKGRERGNGEEAHEDKNLASSPIEIDSRLTCLVSPKARRWGETARRIVRKRDISLHTWTDWGTQLRDAFLSIIETAKKLGVSAYHYINDRVTGQLKMPSLAQLITAFSPWLFEGIHW